jgi:pimeloyl-ACP methyl ester carboxylesterase
MERTVDGSRLRACRLHDGGPGAPTIAFVHGLESGIDYWSGLRGPALRRFSLIALDLPWSGQDGYYWCYRRPACEWLELTLGILPQPPDVLVAHSYGVSVTLDYLQRRPAPWLAGLVLMSTFYRPDFAENDWLVFERCLKAFRAIFEEGITLRRGRPLEPELVASMVDKVLDHVGPPGFMECLSHYLRSPTLRLERIRVPALVLAGTRDPGARVDENAALAAALPNAAFVPLPDCGHFAALQHPDIVARAIAEFVERPLAIHPRPVASIGSPRFR